MSYTRHYHAVIHGTASTTVTVNGQSRSVSVPYSEPVDISIHVDTNRFDWNVHDCRTSVNRLTGAVVAAEAAEVAAKRQSSRKIGNSILNGFFSYIRTDLSQQIRELASKAEAVLMELVEQGKACLHRKAQMGDDYARITKRYSTLFADLDKEMLNRIHALCKPVFNFVAQSTETLGRPLDSNLLGTASIVADETFHVDSILKCSAIKRRAQNLITEANRYLEGTYMLQNSIHEILRLSEHVGLQYLPVAYVESTVSSQGIDRQIYGTQEGLLARSAGINVALQQQFQNKALQWELMDADAAERIQTYFDEELGKSGVSPRIAATIRALKANNRIKIIKTGAL